MWRSHGERFGTQIRPVCPRRWWVENCLVPKVRSMSRSGATTRLGGNSGGACRERYRRPREGEGLRAVVPVAIATVRPPWVIFVLAITSRLPR